MRRYLLRLLEKPVRGYVHPASMEALFAKRCSNPECVQCNPLKSFEEVPRVG